MSARARILALGALAATACGAGVPPVHDAPAPVPPVPVVEVLDRHGSGGGPGRRLADGAARALTGEAEVLAAWSSLAGPGGAPEVLVGEGDGAPEALLLRTVASRLRLLAGAGEEPAGRPRVVVVAAGRIRGGRFVGVTELAGESGGRPVVLAMCDLQRVTSDDGWSWDAKIVVAGPDPVAVDRVALRILDSARRATGAEPLETDPETGDEGLAEAAALGLGTADLGAVRWSKALTEE